MWLVAGRHYAILKRDTERDKKGQKGTKRDKMATPTKPAVTKRKLPEHLAAIDAALTRLVTLQMKLQEEVFALEERIGELEGPTVGGVMIK